MQTQKNESVENENINPISPEEHKFQITDLSSLTWVFKKLKKEKEKANEIKFVAEEQRKEILEWEQKELSTISSRIEFFENMIFVYHAQQLEQDPKSKTISTPYGKSKSRASKEQPDKENEELILQHVIENGMDDYIKNSVKWADLKKSLKIVDISGEKVVVDENGQVIPGVAVKPESITYSVEI